MSDPKLPPQATLDALRQQPTQADPAIPAQDVGTRARGYSRLANATAWRKVSYSQVAKGDQTHTRSDPLTSPRGGDGGSSTPRTGRPNPDGGPPPSPFAPPGADNFWHTEVTAVDDFGRVLFPPGPTSATVGSGVPSPFAPTGMDAGGFVAQVVEVDDFGTEIVPNAHTSTAIAGGPVTSLSNTSNTSNTTTLTAFAPARVMVNPQTPQPLEKAQRLSDRKALQDPAQLRGRALQRDALLTALLVGRPGPIAHALAFFPPDVQLSSHLPLPDPRRFKNDHEAAATLYARSANPDPRLTAYAEWCRGYGNSHHGMELGWAERSEKERSDTLHPKVKALCDALNALDDTTDPATLQRSFTDIKKLLASSKITPHVLARQPFTGTRLMLQKCTLLAPHTEGSTLRAFREKVMKAHALRKDAAPALQAELLKTPIDETKVLSLCTYVNARFTNALFEGFTVANASTQRLETLYLYLRPNYLSKRTKRPLDLFEISAVQMVRYVIRDTLITSGQWTVDGPKKINAPVGAFE